MTAPEPWLLGYLLSEPGCVRYLIIAAAGIILSSFSGLALLSALSASDRRNDGLDALAEPVAVYHYSSHGEARAWDGRVEFVRSGTRTGMIRSGVSSVRMSGGRPGAYLTARYPDGTSERIALGPAGYQEARRAANFAMRFAGRHAYG